MRWDCLHWQPSQTSDLSTPHNAGTLSVLVYLALLSLTACPSVSTSKSLSAPSLCTRLKSSEVTVIYKSVGLTELLYAWGFAVSPLRLIINGLKHSCVEDESGSTCTALSIPRWRTLITCYITCYLTVPLIHKEDACNFDIDYCIKTCTSYNFISIFTFYCSVAFWQLIINYYDD